MPMKVGKTRFRPATLGGILLLDKLQSPLLETDEESSALDCFVAAYILGHDYREVAVVHAEGELQQVALAWCQENWDKDTDLEPCIRECLGMAFETLAKTKWPDSAQTTEVSLFGNGLGYVITTVDLLCNHYGWTVEHVLAMPAAMAFAMLTARKINTGAQWSEPSYLEREQDFDALGEYLDKMDCNKGKN
jgi:hypothetical protein